MKTCNFCGHQDVSETRVQYLYKHHDRFLIVNDVPCEVCEFCGERYFRADRLKAIEKDFNAIVSENRKPKENLLLPVEDFSEIEAL